jgi:hypothetical protein
MIQSIVVDPGNRGFEGNNPGLFYTLASRGTTLGVESDNLSSALYGPPTLRSGSPSGRLFQLVVIASSSTEACRRCTLEHLCKHNNPGFDMINFKYLEGFR